jgi:hypothetical protein
MDTNTIYFTRNTKRAQRGGHVLTIVSEGVTVTITLQDGAPAKVTQAKAKPATPATAPQAAAPATPAKATRAPRATAPAKPATARRAPATAR